MSITIVATVGSASANCLVTEAQYIARTATLPVVPAGVTVSGSTITEAEKKYLLAASQEIGLLPWDGSRTDATQSQAWPREEVTNPDAPTVWYSGDASLLYYANNVIPDRVVNAVIDLSMVMQTAAANVIATADASQGVIRKKVDVLETEWASPQSRPQGWARYPGVIAPLAPLLASQGGGLDVVRV